MRGIGFGDGGGRCLAHAGDAELHWGQRDELYGPTPTLPVNGGNYTVTASFSGNGNYTSANSTPAAITITAAAPTVAAVGGTFAYNGNQEAASATALGIGNVTVSGTFAFTYTGSGSTTYRPVVDASSSVGACTVAVLFRACREKAGFVCNPASSRHISAAW